MSVLYDSLLEEIRALECVDTHEHLYPFEKKPSEMQPDVISHLTAILKYTLLAAGCPEDLCARAEKDPSLSPQERFSLLLPWWNAIRCTGFAQAVRIAARDIFGVPDIGPDTVQAYNEAYRQYLLQPRYEEILRGRCRFSHILLNCPGVLDPDPRFFLPVLDLGAVVAPEHWSQVEHLGTVYGVKIDEFDDYLELCVRMLDDAARRGITTLKCNLAYRRSLLFERRRYDEAEAEFNRCVETGYQRDREKQVFLPSAAFQDYILHFLLSRADKAGLTVQFHTGFLSGFGGTLSNGNPLLLNNLFLAYPRVKFSLFHMGYPYQDAVGALGGMFPNVFADMAWAHELAPAAARRALSEWLEVIPLNKICAFGGDENYPEVTYGHLELARQNTALVLARKTEEGLFTAAQAKAAARMLFCDNPRALYGLR